MDRYWFLTSTTYGSRLPGDRRGFVSNQFHLHPTLRRQNVPGTPLAANVPELERLARANLKCAPIQFNRTQAHRLLEQFQKTAQIREWLLAAVAIMIDHIHIVVGVNGDPSPSRILGDFKSYGSQALSRHWERPLSGTWWTEGGSKRKLKTEESIIAAIRYVASQPNPLLIWVAQPFQQYLASGPR